MIILGGDANNGRGEVRCGCAWFNGGSKKCVDFMLGRKSALCPSVHRLIRPCIRPSIGYMTACPTDYLMSVHLCVCLRALLHTQSVTKAPIQPSTGLSIYLPSYRPFYTFTYILTLSLVCLSVFLAT